MLGMLRPGLLLALVLIPFAGQAMAGPLCERPPTPAQSIVAINSFADSPPVHAVDPARGRCTWAVGLAALPGDTGTAFLVGNRREIVTNLHVADPGCHGNRRFQFRHGFDRGSSLSTIGATVVATGDFCARRRQGQYDYGGDWAIAVLDRDPGAVEHATARRPLSVRAGALTDLQRDNGSFFLVGYSMQFHGGETPYLSPGCKLDRLFSDGVVEHSCNASHRSSGAPILSDSGGRCSLVAIHVGEIAAASGRPRYRADANANVAVLSQRFAMAVNAVARALTRGESAAQIASEMRTNPFR
jgi:hypothetical protein